MIFLKWPVQGEQWEDRSGPPFVSSNPFAVGVHVWLAQDARKLQEDPWGLEDLCISWFSMLQGWARQSMTYQHQNSVLGALQQQPRHNGCHITLTTQRFCKDLVLSFPSLFFTLIHQQEFQFFHWDYFLNMLCSFLVFPSGLGTIKILRLCQ